MGDKNILLVVSNIGLGGGVEKSVINIYNSLQKLGFKVDLLTIYDFVQEYKFNGSRISFGLKYSIGIKRIFNILIKIPFLLYNFIKKSDYSIVITNESDVNFGGIFVKFLYKKIFLVNIIHTNIFHKDVIYFRLRKLHKYADYIITVSKGIEKEFLYEKIVSKNKIRTIYNMFDIEKIIKLSNEELLNKDKALLLDKGYYNFITIGRLTQAKNQKAMLEIFEQFYKKYQDIRFFIIYGGDELYSELQAQIKNYNSKNNIFFLGKRENPYNLLKNADCFLSTSNWEGLPLALIEAGICKIPIISYDFKFGAKEIIDEINTGQKNKQGYLVKNGNYEQFIKYMEYNYKNSKNFNFIPYLDSFSNKNIQNKWGKFLNKIKD